MLIGCDPAPEDIAQQVSDSMQNKFESDTEYKKYQIKVLKVIVVKETGNKYKGMATVKTRNGPERQISLQVTADGKNMMWQTENGAFLFLAQETLSQLFAEPSPPRVDTGLRTLQESASDRELTTRFGKVNVSAENELLLEGKPTSPRLSGNNSLTILGTTSSPNEDMVVVRDNGGTACPAQFYVLIVSAKAARLSESFGTCSDLAEIQASNGVIEMSMPSMQSGTQTFRVERGVITSRVSQ